MHIDIRVCACARVCAPLLGSFSICRHGMFVPCLAISKIRRLVSVYAWHADMYVYIQRDICVHDETGQTEKTQQSVSVARTPRLLLQCFLCRRFTYLWLVGNGGMGYNYNYYY